jgi:predicted transposase/invertase (TIGR01784 family)
MKKNLIRFDWAIKRLLRNKANFGILEGFLSELLEDDIKIENILESESNKETAENKFNKVDLLVKNSKQELIIIEVQNDYQADYLLRMLFGTSKLIVDHMDEGMEYSKVRKVISIHIVYFDLGIGDDYIYYGSTSFWGKHKKDMLQLSKLEKEIFQTDQVSKIHPQYYIIKVNDFDDIAKDTLDEWINFLKTQEIKEGTMAKGLKEAKEKLDYMHLTEEEKRDYQRHIENWRDNEGIIVGNYNKGKYEEKIEIARKCLKKEMPLPDIADLTGLTEDEIKSIKG